MIFWEIHILVVDEEMQRRRPENVAALFNAVNPPVGVEIQQIDVTPRLPEHLAKRWRPTPTVGAVAFVVKLFLTLLATVWIMAERLSHWGWPVFVVGPIVAWVWLMCDFVGERDKP